MTVDGFADAAHWETYWEGFTAQSFETHKIDPLIERLPDGLTSLEIGGFPGQISAYLRRKKAFDVAILDRYVDPQLVAKTEQAFGLEAGCIDCTRADFFDHCEPPRYDLVHSHGFIEHYDDATDILARHLALTRPGGHVLVTMPNLRKNYYGWLVKRYAPDFHATHNVTMMDPAHLERCCRELGVEDFEVRFIGIPGNFWLPEDSVGRAHMLFFEHLGKMLGRIFGDRHQQSLSPGLAVLLRK